MQLNAFTSEVRVATAGTLAERAVAIATLPGATLWHEGQFQGRKVRPSVVTRPPDERADDGLVDWHRQLLVTARGVSVGAWQLLDPHGWPDNQSCRNVLSWSWTPDDTHDRHVVAVSG